MTSDYSARRRAAIEAAAYEVLAEKGYKAASMLEIAKRAGASNQTLYKWYGNKQGLFRALVEGNAAAAKTLLEDHLGVAANGGEAVATLRAFGPVLLTALMSERAIALNRAAAGDVHDTATLGPALAASGRDAVVPLIAELLSRADEAGALHIADASAAAETYVSLLIGDLQVRRVTGAIAAPSRAEIAQRSANALDTMMRLFGPAAAR